MSLAVRLGRRIAMLLALGRQTADTDESLGAPRAQIAFPAGELRDGVVILQAYGLASRPVAGADHAVAFLKGDRRQGISIASSDQRYRPADLAPGETCLYQLAGSRVQLMADGSVLIQPANGQVRVDGTLTVTGDVLANGISLERHVHGGVQPGSGLTGAPQD